MGSSHSAAPISASSTRRDQRKRACSGVGVSSSISAGPQDGFAAPWPPPTRNFPGATLPPMNPARAAPSTMSGNGTSRAKMATKDAAAIAHNQSFFSVREPIRWAAWTTMAVTAGLMP
ncbi:hypothetical protein D3C72_1688080 [compost metagenome]